MGVATAVKKWSLEELHRLPDDGNKYEVVGGELLVTPPPSNAHQSIIAALLEVLVPYVASQRLGEVHTARSVVRTRDSEAEPDLFVRARASGVRNDWENAPAPILVVEVVSPFTRRREHRQKRALYIDTLKVPDYWIVDPESRTLRQVRPGCADVVVDGEVRWHPRGADEPLAFHVESLFRGM